MKELSHFLLKDYDDTVNSLASVFLFHTDSHVKVVAFLQRVEGGRGARGLQ